MDGSNVIEPIRRHELAPQHPHADPADQHHAWRARPPPLGRADSESGLQHPREEDVPREVQVVVCVHVRRVASILNTELPKLCRDAPVNSMLERPARVIEESGTLWVAEPASYPLVIVADTLRDRRALEPRIEVKVKPNGKSSFPRDFRRAFRV